MLAKLKFYAIAGWALLTSVAVALFFYERNKATVDQALVQQSQVNTDVQKDQDAVAANDQVLKTEEEKRQAIEKEKSNVSTDPLKDLTDRINSNK